MGRDKGLAVAYQWQKQFGGTYGVGSCSPVER
jgi:hypothetical protein